MPFVSNDGVKVYYEVVGQGEPMVLQHGIFQSTMDWFEAGHVKQLKDNYKLVLIDARGHGKSSKPHDPESYKMKHHITDITTVLDELEIKKTHFHGFSMGGWIGFGLLKYAPDRLLSAIIGGAQPYDEWIMEWKPFVYNALKENGVDFLHQVVSFFEPHGTPSFAERCIKNDVDAIIALTENTETLHLEDVLSSTSVPCLLWGGDEDNNSWVSVADRIKVIPHGRYISLEGGGNHYKSFYQSKQLKPYIQQFISNIHITNTNR